MKKLIFALAIAMIVNCSFNIENCSAQWQPDIRLTNNPAGSYTSGNNAWFIVSCDSFLHVVWQDVRDGNAEIYYKRSTDAGLSWGIDKRLTNNTNYSYNH